jgi:hypothetical protein
MERRETFDFTNSKHAILVHDKSARITAMAIKLVGAAHRAFAGNVPGRSKLVLGLEGYHTTGHRLASSMTLDAVWARDRRHLARVAFCEFSIQ